MENDIIQEQQKASGLYIASIRDATECVDSRPIGTNFKAVAEYVTDRANEVYGTPEEFHNLLNSYLGAGDYKHALAIGEYALTFYAYDIDILADTIQAAGGSSSFAKGYQLIETAEKIDKKYWGWRPFLMIGQFYITALSNCHPDEYDAIYTKGFAITREYIKHLPLDERGYNLQAKYYLLKSNRAKARAVLETAIYEKIRDADGQGHYIAAPQCCITMIDEILKDTTEYEKIILIAKKGVQFTAQEQPSARLGYFVYRSALARDALIVLGNYGNKQTIQ